MNSCPPPFNPPWERDRESFFASLDCSAIETPAYIIHLEALAANLKILQEVKQATGCKILLALKGFANWRTFPLIRHYLDGVCASSVHEARLGKEEFGKEVHSYAPAFTERDFKEHLLYSDALSFNSLTQWTRYQAFIRQNGPAPAHMKYGLRINPEMAGKAPALYNPCMAGSRLGIPCGAWVEDTQLLEGISFLHFHALCEENADALAAVLREVEKKFSPLLPKMQFINFGGGHHITRRNYDIAALCQLVADFQRRYDVQVILEPGEAVALNAGVLATRVLDIVGGSEKIAILDTSAEAHMPDVLAMPYRPAIIGAGAPHEYPHNYLLGGLTCLAGDLMGHYSFKNPLQIGDLLIFQNMAIYTTVKNTLFNGIRLPDILMMDSSGAIVHRTAFGYETYKQRL